MAVGDMEVSGGPKIRLYLPGSIEATHLPMILFAHGGGWFAGDLETEDRTCRIVCAGVPAVVASVEYRCDFHVPLGDMVDDLHSAFGWARENAACYGADPDKIVVWGGSGGGTLATALVDRLVKENNGS